MLRQVYQPAGAVFIAAHNVLSQRQVQERLREYIIEEGRDCMYLYGFDIGGTKCAVILAKMEGDQVDFLERYEMKTLGDWKKVLDELSENALMIAKKYGLTTGTEGENCVICGGISCGGPLSPDRKWILSPPNLQGWDQVPVVEYLEEKLGIPVKMENDADAGALAEWKFGAGKGCQNMIFLTFGTGLGSGLILNGQLYRGSTGMAGEAGHIRMENEGPKGYGKAGSLEGFCSGRGSSCKRAGKRLGSIVLYGRRDTDVSVLWSYCNSGMDEGYDRSSNPDRSSRNTAWNRYCGNFRKRAEKERTV